MMEIEYLGHSAFVMRDGSNEVLIDPFISGNPSVSPSAYQVRPTLILVSHGHSDHSGDAAEISRRCDCPVLTTHEVGNRLAELGAKVMPAHIGGEFIFPFGWVKLFPAVHSSSFDDVHNIGVPCSFLVRMDGKVIYHAGDTALFGDMRLVGEEAPIDIALLPVGGTFTMGLKDAVRAMSFLGAKRMVPMHYGTFETISLEVSEIRRACSGAPFELTVMGPGDRLELD